MGRSSIFLLVVLLLGLKPECRAQYDYDVSDPSFELKGNTVLIHYDILNSTQADRFEVTIEIIDEDGNRIRTRALNGDIGSSVRGGRGKLISWDLEADGIVMDAEITVNISAVLIPPEPAPVQPVETAKPEPSEFHRTGLILQSLALPGLGLSRLTGKPHWLRGVAGYGCIAGTLVLNRMAVSTYDDFLASESTDESDALLTKAIRQDNISEVLAFAAVGIWAADILWTILGTRDLNRATSYHRASGMRFMAGYDPITASPVVGINFRF